MSRPLQGFSNSFISKGKSIKQPDLPSSQKGYTLRKPIEYNPLYYGHLMKVFLSLDRPYRYARVDLENQDLSSEIRRFLVCLDAYLESPHPVQDEKTLFHLAALGPEGSKNQKNFKTSCLLRLFDTKPYEDNPELTFDVPLIRDIGDVFNYSYLPFWKEEDPDDYKYYFEDVNVDEKYLKKFCKVIKNLLPDRTYEEKDWREIVLNLSETSKLDKELKKSKSYLLAHKIKYPAKDIGTCLRTVVPVKPQGYRDTVICQYDASVRISWIDKQLMRILNDMEEHIQLKSRDLIEKRLKKLSKKYSYFYMRDIKKEGITKPRILLKIMLRCLHEKYPELRAFEFEDFYDNFSIIINEEEKFPKRGHGLGMANALTTLMNIAIYHLAINEKEYDIIENDSYSLSLNDDFVVGFKTLEDLQSYEDKELKIMNKLSLLFASKKSFASSQGFVIAEEYFSPYRHEKNSYFRAEILKALCCLNITHAKSLVNSYIDLQNIDLWNEYKEEIISYWGYEFFPHEIEYPFIVGGWISEKINGISLDLINIDQLPYKSYVSRAYQACKHIVPKIFENKKKTSKFVSPLSIFGNLDLNQDQKNFFNVEAKDIQSKLLRSKTKPSTFERAWNSLYKQRQNTFKRSSPMNFEDFIIDICQNGSCDYIPIDIMISHHIPMDIYKENLHDIYYAENPIISYLAISNTDIFGQVIPEDFSINSKEEVYSKQYDLSSMNLDNISLAFNKFRDNKAYKMRPSFKTLSDDNDFQNSYVHPILCCQTFYSMNQYQVPILKTKYRNPIIKKKESIYGLFIPFNYRALFQDYFDTRKAIKENIELLNYSLDVIGETIAEEKEKLKTPIVNKEEETECYFSLLGPVKNVEDKIEKFLDLYATNKMVAAEGLLLSASRLLKRELPDRNSLEFFSRVARFYELTFKEIELAYQEWLKRIAPDSSDSEPEVDYWDIINQIPD